MDYESLGTERFWKRFIVPEFVLDVTRERILRDWPDEPEVEQVKLIIKPVVLNLGSNAALLHSCV